MAKLGVIYRKQKDGRFFCPLYVSKEDFIKFWSKYFDLEGEDDE